MSAPSDAVFLSYASQDAEAARRIGAALRAAGLEVWFDQAELRGGDAWDRMIRERIRSCRLFVAVISAQTNARDEGYFRREWRLAVDRTLDMDEQKAFLIPVVIDATPESEAAVPDAFRRVQWTRLPGGAADPDFTARIASLLEARQQQVRTAGDTGSTPKSAPPTPSIPTGTAAASSRRKTPHLAFATAIALVILGGAALLWWQAGHHQHPAQDRANENSVAVLPFVDMSEKHDQEYFSDGLSEELIDVLTRVPGLRVPARTSSFSFKGKSVTVGEIARELRVSHVLEGSVRRAADRLRVTAQLVRADDGFHEWSQSYDREIQDVFTVQRDIARSVAEQLRVTLLEADVATRSVNPEAHNLYLQGRFRLQGDTLADLDAAVDSFERSIALDPNYAASWAWLAYTHTRRTANGNTNEATYLAAKEAARRAMTLDPHLVQGYVAGGIAALQYSLDWATAGRLLDRAIALDPNDPIALQFRGHLTQAIGSIEDAERYMRRAADLDPLNPLHRRYLARIVLNAGRAGESAAILRQLIEENPRYPALHWELARALLMLGKPAEAAAAYESDTSDTWRLLGLPIACQVTHREAQAQAALRALIAQSAGSEFQVAEAYAVFGQPDKAFEWLSNARVRRDAGLMYLRRDPLLASIASDPRYRTLLRELKLPE